MIPSRVPASRRAGTTGPGLLSSGQLRPGGGVRVVPTGGIDGAMLGDVVVADTEAITGSTSAAVRAQAIEALEPGRAVAFGAGALDGSGELRLDAVRYPESGGEAVDSVSLPAVEVDTGAAGARTVPATVVSADMRGSAHE